MNAVDYLNNQNGSNKDSSKTKSRHKIKHPCGICHKIVNKNQLQLLKILTLMSCQSTQCRMTFLHLLNIIHKEGLFHVSHKYEKSIKNFDQLQNVLSALKTKFDLIGITETKQQVDSLISHSQLPLCLTMAFHVCFICFKVPLEIINLTFALFHNYPISKFFIQVAV